ncbi:polymorphic toxin type 43 domain-containing protein [Acinetobacter sp. UGAL515B_02]|nr:polymorphic toxin type 43 domain-containing protein [Acinetobacter sp. UGAL515B_02]WON80963.1 polymorphic toxin type 43 domain-containing protein [Acinetobacter sp. UGAL515B_02]
MVEYYPTGAAKKTLIHIVSPDAKLSAPTSEQAIKSWKGSGPLLGVIAINKETSASALKNYNGKGVEFIFDPKSNTFAFGNISAFKHGSPHEQLVQSIGINRSNNFTVGGTMVVKNGVVNTTENSGHYGKNWTPEVRQQFKLFLTSKGIKLTHEVWSK